MTLKILFAAEPALWPEYETLLLAAFADAGLKCDLRCDFEDPAEVDYIVYAPNSGLQDFSPFTGARAVLNLWAGVEALVGNETLTQPLARMVDSGLSEGMTEWVTGHVLRHHLGMDAHIHGLKGEWIFNPPPLARDRPVGILGLGELGQAAAAALTSLNFPVTGWSRRPKDVEGITCLHGDDGLKETLKRSEILVILLPLTGDTENLMDAGAFALLPKGAVVINPARGAIIDDDALLAALDREHLSHATLDVFRTEPLPPAHPFWAHSKVTVTPHIASQTRANSASAVIAENVRRSEAGEELLHLVDRRAGY